MFLKKNNLGEGNSTAAYRSCEYALNSGDLFYIYCSCSLSSAEVRDLYYKGSQEEAEESTNIQFVDRETVLDLTPNTDMWSTLAPSAKGCIMLYKLHNG